MEDLNPEDIEEALKFDEKDLSNEDLFELRNQMKSDEDEDVNDDSERPTELTSKLLKEIIENFQYACDFAKENDPNEVCSSKISVRGGVPVLSVELTKLVVTLVVVIVVVVLVVVVIILVVVVVSSS